ncbi:substrate-binding domain-containing protein [Marinovum algicola]|uniref:substrate-binding domain-containing protein n=1 Tax=Marinovum algicola TaxID=42444 RepID=UPI0032EECFE6
MNFVKLTASTLAIAAVSATAASARDQIRIVGSSTVFPFSTAVAEQFGKSTDFATPVVESTGSGGGVKLFCAASAKSILTSPTRRVASSSPKSRPASRTV